MRVLHAYLDYLLRNRERLLATNGLDDWARAEATSLAGGDQQGPPPHCPDQHRP
ncbi:MAG: hypothetical protein L0H84_15720 [Pseudonocardia sp.]|nr:hypothetical protein [Pseudonocardia sp.]